MNNRLLEKLNAFLALEKQLRNATSVEEIARLACSDSQALLPLDASLYFRAPDCKLIAASNVTSVDDTSAEVHQYRTLLRQHGDKNQCEVQCAGGDSPRHLLIVRLGDCGHLMFLRASPASSASPFSESEKEIQREIASAVHHALLARRGAARRPWHIRLSRRKIWVCAALLLVCALPIRQSVLAPAILAAVEPRIVSAKTEGVVSEIAIEPNTPVQPGDLLFTLDSAEVEAEIDKAQQEISLYRERLRMTRQYNFREAAAGHRLAQAETDLSIRHLDLEYQRDILEKTRVRAPESGVAIFTEPSEWIGRRVVAGEKVMEIVNPGARQIQIDLPTADAIALPQNAEAIFYAEANPLAPIRGHLKYHSLLTSEGEDLPASYRLIANISEDNGKIRINTRGYARIYGARVPLIYYLLRRPLADARRWLGV